MLELSFEQPEHGWVPVCLKANSAVIDFIASDVPNNPVQELVDALSIVNNGREVEVWWHLEPDGYYFRFVPQGNDVTLSIVFSKGSFEGDKQEVAVLHGRKAEVLLPIWRALRRFETLDVMEPHWPPLNSQGLKELGSKLRA